MFQTMDRHIKPFRTVNSTDYVASSDQNTDKKSLTRVSTLVRESQEIQVLICGLERLSVIRWLWRVSFWYRYFRKAVPNCRQRWQM